MSVTHGGRARRFEWSFDGDRVHIRNEDGLEHRFLLAEIAAVLGSIQAEFGDRWFLLANNVEKMYRGTETPGLGSTIHHLHGGDTLHAQGASYLGVILEGAGILSWNGRARGIAWRLLTLAPHDRALRSRLAGKRGTGP